MSQQSFPSSTTTGLGRAITPRHHEKYHRHAHPTCQHQRSAPEPAAEGQLGPRAAEQVEKSCLLVR
jgi:hypothetical protein